jgi:hypothetical protein
MELAWQNERFLETSEPQSEESRTRAAKRTPPYLSTIIFLFSLYGRWYGAGASIREDFKHALCKTKH